MTKKPNKHHKQKPPAASSVQIVKKPTTETKPGLATSTVASPPPANQGGRTNTNAPDNATVQQRRAHFALTKIRKLVDEWKEDAKKQKEFNSYASAMPFMIHANGLGQTAAFYRRKGTDHTYYRLYELLGNWLSQPDQPFAGHSDLLDGVTQSNMDTYLAAQAESMLFLDWVKKLASAFLACEEETAS